MAHKALLVLAGLAVALLQQTDAAASPWVYSDNAPIPEGTIRITTLGSGSPDVRKEQASSPQLGDAQGGVLTSSKTQSAMSV